jgi:hypothetical protein
VNDDPALDLWMMIFGFATAVLLPRAWHRNLTDRREVRPWRRYLLFSGLSAASASFVLWMLEMVLDLGRTTQFAFPIMSYVGLPLAGIGYGAAVVGTGQGRILLGLAAFALNLLWVLRLLSV